MCRYIILFTLGKKGGADEDKGFNSLSVFDMLKLSLPELQDPSKEVSAIPPMPRVHSFRKCLLEFSFAFAVFFSSSSFLILSMS